MRGDYGDEWRPIPNFFDLFAKQLDQQIMGMARKLDLRTPSPTHPYDSLDHFLFQSDIHWNGKTVDSEDR
jgi:hypothetical protein